MNPVDVAKVAAASIFVLFVVGLVAGASGASAQTVSILLFFAGGIFSLLVIVIPFVIWIDTRSLRDDSESALQALRELESRTKRIEKRLEDVHSVSAKRSADLSAPDKRTYSIQSP